MKKVKLGQYIIIFLLTSNCQMVVSQDKFISYHDFELAYRNNSDLNSLSRDYDLLHILLLDSSYKKEVFKYNPGLEEEYYDYSAGLKLNSLTVGFFTQHTDIKKIFESEDRIKNCLFDDFSLKVGDYKIRYPVYVKNNTAIAEIITNSTTDFYFFILHKDKGVVQINWLGGIIE